MTPCGNENLTEYVEVVSFWGMLCIFTNSLFTTCRTWINEWEEFLFGFWMHLHISAIIPVMRTQLCKQFAHDVFFSRFFLHVLRSALSFIRALSTLLKCIAVQGVQLLCEFESKENIYSCHYLAWNAFTVKLIQLFRWKWKEEKYRMQSSKVNSARSLWVWMECAVEPRKIGITSRSWSTHSLIYLAITCRWRLHTQKYRILSSMKYALDLI